VTKRAVLKYVETHSPHVDIMPEARTDWVLLRADSTKELEQHVIVLDLPQVSGDVSRLRKTRNDVRLAGVAVRCDLIV